MDEVVRAALVVGWFWWAGSVVTWLMLSEDEVRRGAGVAPAGERLWRVLLAVGWPAAMWLVDGDEEDEQEKE